MPGMSAAFHNDLSVDHAFMQQRVVEQERARE